ncbi:MAG: transporter substrate-binding domain-containing protein [Nitrospirae bacterium]|nr:transporter substrate-binding domain-containing protein [Nitrospirota bacterium]
MLHRTHAGLALPPSEGGGTAPRIGIMGEWASILLITFLLQGCGLVVDAIQKVWPLATNELDAICARGQIRVGMAVEPFQPFVFPAIYTDEGLRVTGLDVELVREITVALSQRCGGTSPIVPTLQLIRFRNLFIELTEGHLDLFVSSISANVAAPGRTGLAYSNPYFDAGGIGGITARPEVAELVAEYIRQSSDRVANARVMSGALAGLTVAVQEGTSAQFYAEANLKGITLVLCDSLPAAFESQDPPIDLILGKEPVLNYTVRRVRKDWQLLKLDNGKPLILTHEQYAIVTDEESYRLRRFLNDLLFRLDESGRLTDMRQRWLEDNYAYPRRAATEGLPFAAEKMPQHYDQGQCRLADNRSR